MDPSSSLRCTHSSIPSQLLLGMLPSEFGDLPRDIHIRRECVRVFKQADYHVLGFKVVCLRMHYYELEERKEVSAVKIQLR